MNPYQAGQFIIAQAAIARAQIRAMGMQAENEQRKIEGKSMAYDEKAFDSLLTEEGIHWNASVEMARKISE